MPKSRSFLLILIVIITVMLMHVVNPTEAYADDGVSTEPSEEETVEEEPLGEDPQTDETQTTEADPAQVEEIGEEIQSEPNEPLSTEDEPSSESEESPPVEEPAETEVDLTVAEVLEQAPEGVDVVVINEEGQVEPLVTEAASEIVENVDPIWCPGSQEPTPNSNGCTDNHSNITDLINELVSDPTTFNGSGTIYFTLIYTDNDATFDGSTLADLTDLVIQGGWNGDPSGAGYDIIGNTTFDGVSLNIINWNGNVTLNNILVEEATGTGLQIITNGDINLNNTSSTLNSNTGAYLDNCQYGNTTPGLCDGSGNVSVMNSSFDNNGLNGLTIDSGGDTLLENVQAISNGLNGVYITGADDDGTGDVVVLNSDFTGNANGNGLDVFSDGNITLTDILASLNGTGVVLDSTGGTGNVIVNVNSDPNSIFDSNLGTGLHIESGGSVTLNDVLATNNTTNGTYVEAAGDINVTDSQFNGNVQVNIPTDPGLFAKSNGSITLTNVVANDNQFGAGVVLETVGTGSIDVINSTFNSNGTFGLQAKSNDGDITISNVEASTNVIKGLYLTSSGLGNIFIENSNQIVDNGEYGIYAHTSQGNINLDNVTVTGNNITGIGAFLKAYNGGDVYVSNSTFETNTGTGLVIVTSTLTNLVNVIAVNNGGNGVEIYTPQTYGCRCPKQDVINIIANVDGGSFTNNGSYGLMVKPGPDGELNFVSSPIFANNSLGDFLLDLSDPSICDPKPPKPSKPPVLVVEVPFEGGDPVVQDCENYSGTLLQLPDGTSVVVGCPFDGSSMLNGLTKDGLPGELPTGMEFGAGINIGLTDLENNIVNNIDGSITISFKIPEDSSGRNRSILFWDPTLNDGQGGWKQLPPFEIGTSFPLNPDDPEDDRMILSGVKEKNGFLTVTVNFPGIFIMVSP